MQPNQQRREAMATKARTLWAFALSSIAIFMTALDNLVVTTVLPVIKQQLGGGIDTLERTVNGYTLTFAVLLLTGAALGDRFGRRRMFVAGVGIFTLASAAAALAPSIQLLIAARAFQGVGGAIITPAHPHHSPAPSQPRSAAPRSAPGAGSKASRWRSARLSAAPSPRASAGSGSSGSTSRSG
jgi:MFS family permease